jgi:glycosyltransferase involved in cell wall biosynthesis
MKSEQKLKVLVISEYYPRPKFPALGIFVKRQVDELRRNCDVTVVCPIRVFPPLRLFKLLLRFRFLRLADETSAWLADVVRTPFTDTVDGIRVYYPRYTSLPIQILHPTVGLFAWLFLRRMLLKLSRKHSFAIVHAHYAVPCGTLATRLAARIGANSVLSIHGRDFTYTARKGKLNRQLLLKIFNGVDRINSNSSWTSRRLIEAGASSDRVRLIELGAIEISEGKTVRRTGRLKVLTLGYLIPRKKFDVTIKAIARAIAEGADFELEIVGDGPQRQNLENLAEELGIADRASFAGYAAPNEVAKYYDACDIFALPSVDEAFGLVYVEALARGRPPIGCRGEGGPQDLADKGDCILLVEPNDVSSLAAALKRLHDDPDLRLRLAETGQRIVADSYTWRRNAERTVEQYRELIKGR